MHPAASVELVNATPPRTGAPPETVLVDCHTHFHGLYDDVRFLDSAARNLQRGAAQLGANGSSPGCLVMTESTGSADFSHFSRIAAGGGRRPPWTFRPTEEDTSLIACHEDGRRLALIAGRQIATAEGLEVLTMPSSLGPEDGLPVRDVIRKAAAERALAVIPWGFGKWWLGRRRALLGLLEDQDDFLLADSGCRLRGSLQPGLLAVAAAKSLPILAGSDPLPLPGHETRAGSYGCAVEGPLDWDEPASWLLMRLTTLTTSPPRFGQLQRLGPFFWSQLRMQVKKRSSGHPR